MQKRAPECVLELPLPTCRLSSSSWPECRCHQKGWSRGFPTCSINPCVGSQAAPFHISSYFWQLKLLTKSHPRVWEVHTLTILNWVWKPSDQCLENCIFYCDPLSSGWQRHFSINTSGLFFHLSVTSLRHSFLARKILLLSLSSFNIDFVRGGEKAGLLTCTVSCWILTKLHYLLFYLSWNLWGLSKILGISVHAWVREAHL